LVLCFVNDLDALLHMGSPSRHESSSVKVLSASYSTRIGTIRRVGFENKPMKLASQREELHSICDCFALSIIQTAND
jgi:hypothetical protein